MTVTNREGFFAAAMALLARDGRAGLRLATLCRDVGVTSGSFYHHFGGWDGFVDALLAHWEAVDTHRLAELAAREPDPEGRLDVLKHLALTFPHEAETAIRAWAHGDERVAAVQARVDEHRHRVVAEALVAADVEPERADRLADLALAVLIGRQQLLGPTDVGELLRVFDLVSDLGRHDDPDHSRGAGGSLAASNRTGTSSTRGER
ncbi:TetR/AcrR family transcriptional regulator [Actinomycetospora cinnamomea]|uniref:TetR family transcriptional regulator n=1 Tax=Actinomycetospora cinnamomea TaxID=663609 RepID=A0A2U1F172_9PSEU|nr:TetR/AcrR family transcriptional regulator [Actinomycetospora cinnamomea]PVZ05879.1 TetR family transcriptional regulator [Actinomycetospora cinnamomea]